ncbi:hypothetical protein N7495_004782 [Penicillium taxi]|uniref:uncharacterized protein n=1 Tax=Penicillium taxi TaxID=168475 RepID=UPI00254521CE|nr:uncharacterized protein N7495_004782 [Penicillium taxi]KAJ5900038.1 hypothetical protein N7495_004782 [Penicillium taxi]
MKRTRRNGQLPSCEPCRKSKLRCDHESPVCGRCIRNKRDQLCVYHPAPLTQATKPRPHSRTQSRRHTGQSTKILSFDTDNDWGRKKTASTGLLGHNKYSDFFNGDVLEGTSTDSVVVDEQQIRLGARILSLLEHLPSFRVAIEAECKGSSSWIKCPQFLDTLLGLSETSWENIQREEGDEEQRMLKASKRLFEKQNCPIDIHTDMTWDEFAAASSGRWEWIGLLFQFVGLAGEYLPKDSALYKEYDGVNGKNFALTVMTVGDICIEFCQKAAVINDFVCLLICYNMALLSVIYGDTGESSLSNAEIGSNQWLFRLSCLAQVE